MRENSLILPHKNDDDDISSSSARGILVLKRKSINLLPGSASLLRVPEVT
jgi:hypothetical protein